MKQVIIQLVFLVGAFYWFRRGWIAIRTKKTDFSWVYPYFDGFEGIHAVILGCLFIFLGLFLIWLAVFARVQ